MAIAVYIKEQPKIFKTAAYKKRDRFFFAFISFIGLSAVIFTAWPLLVWQLVTLPKLTGGVDQLPIPTSEVLSVKSTIASNVQVVKDPDGFSYFVPTNYSLNGKGERPAEFYLTIAKLKIFKAKVKVDSLNFYNSLSHFPDSALPGEVGNSFITGHSVLPQFYDPNNYLTIFTKLSDLEIGDDVLVEIEGRTLHFTVQYAKVVDPRDLSVLAPISPNGRNLTLMTCVPPGANS